MVKKAGKKTKEIAEFLGVNRKTVWKWNKRAHHQGKESFRDKSRRPHHINKKIIPIVENAIIILSSTDRNRRTSKIILKNFYLLTKEVTI